MKMEDKPLVLEGIELDVNKGSKKTNQRTVFGTDAGESPLILNDVKLFSNTGSKEMTEMEAKAEGFNILPSLDYEIKTPSSNKLPQLTDEDLKYLNDDKGLTLTDADLSDLDDSSFKLPKPPML